MEDMIPLSEAAEMLGLKMASLRSQIRFGALKADKLGPIWVVTRAEVERYREQSLGKTRKSAMKAAEEAIA